jgi:hypothetical protein
MDVPHASLPRLDKETYPAHNILVLLIIRYFIYLVCFPPLLPFFFNISEPVFHINSKVKIKNSKMVSIHRLLDFDF